MISAAVTMIGAVDVSEAVARLVALAAIAAHKARSGRRVDGQMRAVVDANGNTVALKLNPGYARGGGSATDMLEKRRSWGRTWLADRPRGATLVACLNGPMRCDRRFSTAPHALGPTNNSAARKQRQFSHADNCANFIWN